MSDTDDLARAVHHVLTTRRAPSPPLSVLEQLFSTMFYSSLRTEESSPITYGIAFLSAENPDPDPPLHVRRPRWKTYEIEPRPPFDVASICKLAPASDYRTSLLAVDADESGCLRIWGFVDGHGSAYKWKVFDSEGGWSAPGLFQARVEGVGRLSVSTGFLPLAELSADRLLTAAVPVFDEGHVADTLLRLSSTVERRARSIRHPIVPAEGLVVEDEGPLDVADLTGPDLVSSIRRLLLRIKRHGHGGCVILLNGAGHPGLRFKYELQYDVLADHIAAVSAFRMATWQVLDRLDEIQERGGDAVPVDDHLDLSIFEGEADDAREALDSALWFISLLTRVDGAIVIDDELNVIGFGAEILTTDAPAHVVRGIDPTGQEWLDLDYQHLGTRHRSAMRFIDQAPGALAFVVSEDGDVRAIGQVDGRVTVWEDVQIELSFDSLASEPVQRGSSNEPPPI